MGSLAGPVLNSEEAAKYCGLRGGAKSMRNLKYLGTGPKWHHQGRVLVFYPADLDQWLRERRSESKKPGVAAPGQNKD